MKNTIRVERAKMQISQKELGEAIGLTGVAISQIETEKHDPKVSTAIKIAMFFGLEAEGLFGD
jgi:putative transcriptional regulator